MSKNKINKTAFTLIEISVVIVVIGILIASIMQGAALITNIKVATARSLTKSSPVASMPDLMLWYDSISESAIKADEMVDGQPISAWYDINPTSSSSLDLINNGADSKKPTYDKYSFNKLPTLRFNGDQFLYRGNIDAITSKGSATIFAVLYPERLNAGQEYIIFQPHTNCKNNIEIGFNVYPGSYQEYGIHAGCRYSTLTPFYSMIKDTQMILSMVLLPRPLNSGTTNNIKIYKNGQSQTLGTYNNGYNGNLAGEYARLPSMLAIAVRGSNPLVSFDAGFKGLIGEIIIFQTALEDVDREAVEEYLSQKWRIKLK